MRYFQKPRPVLFQNRSAFRQNWVFIGGIFLCFYFTYFIIQGDRSYIRLLGLQSAIEHRQAEYDVLKAKRTDLAHQVDMLRPGSINRDYLEERARAMLGYRAPGEVDVVSKAGIDR